MVCLTLVGQARECYCSVKGNSGVRVEAIYPRHKETFMAARQFPCCMLVTKQTHTCVDFCSAWCTSSVVNLAVVMALLNAHKSGEGIACVLLDLEPVKRRGHAQRGGGGSGTGSSRRFMPEMVSVVINCLVSKDVEVCGPKVFRLHVLCPRKSG